MHTCRTFCSGGMVSVRRAASISSISAVARKYPTQCHYSTPLRADNLHTALASIVITVDGEK